MTSDTTLVIPDIDPPQGDTRWFSSDGCVVYGESNVVVLVAGTLIGTFGPGDVFARNLLLVGLAANPYIRKGKLAQAFGLSVEQLRRICRHVDAKGLNAIPARSRGGSETKVTPAARKRLFELFDSGANGHDAFLAINKGKKGKKNSYLSYPTVRRVRQSWKVEHAAEQKAEKPEKTTPVQPELVAATTVDEAVTVEVGYEVQVDQSDEETSEQCAPSSPTKSPQEDLSEGEGPEEEAIEGTAVHGGRFVQHVGGWLLLAVIHGMGLYEAVQRQWKRGPKWLERLRVALDAVVLALGLGQRCVEGVRRLRTLSGRKLLRAKEVPSESWTRRILKEYVDEGSAPWAHLSMMQIYLERARAESEGAVVFYVDNHLRPYTGKHTIRKGWRMQDKRVQPGATDYYVHDEDGRPVFRLDVPSNDTLTAWLSPVTRLLRASLGEKQRILVAFDRAGAFPEQLAKLRQENFDFVTYERRPYPLLSPSAFDEEVVIETEGSKEAEVIGVHESRHKNLGKGRGRVRRIALRMPDGQQVNLLAVSKEKTERLIEVMLGRWVQENGFKHGKERWGINQLDRRKVEPYSPETIIPNPARRRLENALRIARRREGEARRQLARLRANAPKRVKAERDLAESLAEQEQLEAQRPHVPKHAPLAETELKDKLVYHAGDYKTLIDTIRIACANAESDLAVALSPHLRRPREAKKSLANLFASPGEVRINSRSITVTLSPAGTHNEQEAFQALFREVNRWKLTLPGDQKCRPLRFRSQLS